MSTFRKYLSFITNLRLSRWISTHTKTSVALALVILVGGYYGYGWIFPTATTTTYALGTVTRGTVVATVSGSGQVSTSNKIDIKPQASGLVTWVAVKSGDTVHEGQVIAQIDSTNAQKAVVEAEQSLATSKLQYQRDSVQAPIDYQGALENQQTAEDNLVTEYDSTYSELSTTYLDLPGAATTMNNILFGYDLSPGKTLWNADALIHLFTADADNQTVVPFADAAKAKNTSARAQYDKSIAAFKTISRTSTTNTLEASLADAIKTTTAVADTLQSEVNFLGEIIDLAGQRNVPLPSAVTTLQSSARSALTTVNGDLTSLLNQKKSLATAKQAISDAKNTVRVLNVGNQGGSNPISLQISANSIASAEANLLKLKRDLANYTIIAPFSGTLSSVAAVRGDTAPSVAATIITDQKIAQLTLNEVDAAKVAIGNKATLTFDAIDDLSLTGKVSEIDTVGTVSQGVVSYAIKISFDSQDVRIKSGMTVNATIQTAVQQDVLVVPSSAVKVQGTNHYVLVFTPPITLPQGVLTTTSATTPTQVPVDIGISDDISVEVVSGLTEGEQIVTKTSTTGQTTTTTTTSTRGGAGSPSIRL